MKPPIVGTMAIVTDQEEMFLAALVRPDLVLEFDRLYGTNLSRSGTALDLAVDDASGRFKSDLARFRQFTDDLCARMPRIP